MKCSIWWKHIVLCVKVYLKQEYQHLFFDVVHDCIFSASVIFVTEEKVAWEVVM